MPRLRRRALIVAALLAAALGLRVGEVQRTSYRPVGDAVSYLALAGQIASSGDYSTPRGTGGTRGATAYFPPAYPYFLAAVHKVDGSVSAARLSQALLGTVTVALTGAVALEAFGEITALLAMALAAVYPVLIELSGTLVAESLLTPLVLAAVWASLKATNSHTPKRWIAGAGVLTGLAILTHVNAIVLLLPLGVAAWKSTNATGAALLIAAAALTIAPWTIRNTIELHHFIPVADETGVTLAGTYNPASAHNQKIPYGWRYYSAIPQDRKLVIETRGLTEPQLDAKLTHQALSYITHHPLSPVYAAAHNTLRLLELEGSFARKASAAAIGLPTATANIATGAFWLILALAIAGALTKAARGAPKWLYAAPTLIMLTTVVVNAETPRFREPIDPFLILLAACAASAARVQKLRRPPVPAEAEPAVPSRRDTQLVEVVERLA